MAESASMDELLEAAKNADEMQLRLILGKMLTSGAATAEIDFNATDSNGRTLLSHLCTTNMYEILEICLKLPGIDVNKADNEGNTPLHHAAQAGILEMVNTLLKKCFRLTKDPKNVFGFTPLMKAAIQGHSTCSKYLILGGASPFEVDYGRGYRAEQWARLCGRYSCADLIERCSRNKVLQNTITSNQDDSTNKVPLAKTISSPVEVKSGVKSKLKGFFTPKKTKKVETCKTDLVTYMTAAALSVNAQMLPSHGNKRVIKALVSKDPQRIPVFRILAANDDDKRTIY